ncbi:DUF3784 domain-containing protein [Vagococcus fluvialis]|uniref:DUF3784 domain-containing protein n=1 Tax=Vagococcus fluvialis TaxID=2738 RepID=UPI00242B9190|nr:DUF3784 domain-containing protein [Vagococcus fluvialis]WNF89272.1 DUF3784 domain-containing protein [Vagococcus fluvialis]
MLENIILGTVLLLVLAIVILCFMAGFKFRQGKWLMLIAGYNDLDKETRDKMDSQKIGRETGNISIATGIVIILFTFVVWGSSYIPFFQQTENALLLILLPTAIFIYWILKHVKKSSDYYKKFK